MPFGQVPALEVDGEVITQSFTIARFVAKQHGLGGKDNLAAAQADMVVDCLVDLLQRGTKNTQICLIQTWFGWVKALTGPQGTAILL